MGDFRTQKCFMTHVTHDTCDLLLFPEKNEKSCQKIREPQWECCNFAAEINEK